MGDDNFVFEVVPNDMIRKLFDDGQELYHVGEESERLIQTEEDLDQFMEWDGEICVEVKAIEINFKSCLDNNFTPHPKT